MPIRTSYDPREICLDLPPKADLLFLKGQLLTLANTRLFAPVASCTNQGFLNLTACKFTLINYLRTNIT
jgi:hypothetical protein